LVAIQGTTQRSYAETIQQGHFKTKVAERMETNELDVSDVYYNKFLINGKTEAIISVKGGDKVRLRISNGGA
jgi:hypothetical protein